MKSARLLPNLFTQLNLISGFLGIVQAAFGQLEMAAWFIVAAAFFDLIDGPVARYLKIESQTGKQLDSLADIVSFGVLPTFILSLMLGNTHVNWVYSFYVFSLPFASLFPLIYLASSAYRLAVFNQMESKNYFEGLPIPASALVIASLPLILKYDLLLFSTQTIYLEPVVLSPIFLILAGVILALLQLGKIPLFALNKGAETGQRPWHLIIFLVISVLLLLFLSFAAIPLILLLYLLISIFFKSQFHEIQSPD